MLGRLLVMLCPHGHDYYGCGGDDGPNEEADFTNSWPSRSFWVDTIAIIAILVCCLILVAEKRALLRCLVGGEFRYHVSLPTAKVLGVSSPQEI